MSKSADDLSALFRSLGPDDSSFQATETAAAREAAQRWPLFQAVSPRKSETTPTLSAQERQRWSHQEQHEGGERKPALSLPGLSDKMARSLSKMSGRTTDAPMQNPARRAEPDTPPVAPRSLRSLRSTPQMTPMESRSALFSASPVADPVAAVVGDAGLNAAIKGMSGAAAGREVALVKVVTTIGKSGVAVATITKRPHGFVVAHVEGVDRPSLNGTPIGTEPVTLKNGDVLELAGAQMQFVQH